MGILTRLKNLSKEEKAKRFESFAKQREARKAVALRVKENIKARVEEQRQLANRRREISKKSIEASYQEREKQEIRLAREREKIRADRILQRERAVARGGSSSGGMMSIAQNYTRNAQSNTPSFSLFGQQDMAKPVRKKVVRYVKVKPKPRVKRRRVVRYVTQKPQAPQRYNVTGW